MEQIHATNLIELDKQRSRAIMGKGEAVVDLEKELGEERTKSKRLEENLEAFMAAAALWAINGEKRLVF
jgi:hypothetical protein